MPLRLALAASLLSLAAAAPWDCDPLQPDVCHFPWPNDFWRSATNRLNMTAATWPKTKAGKPIDLALSGWDVLDGFSPLAPVLVYFADLDVATLPSFLNISRSMDDDCPTILLDPANNRRLPHWVELDHSSDDSYPSGYNRALLLWPSARLNDSANYIVAFRSLRNSTDQPIPASAAFAALRDNTSSSDVTVEARRQKYETAIFPALTAAGVERSSLLLAWDFTTASTYQITNRLLSMRDQSINATAKDGIKFVITKTTDNPNQYIARQVQGEMDVPFFLNTNEVSVKARLVVSPDDPNVPVTNGTKPVKFTVIIPTGLVRNKKQGPIISYGHGLFADQTEMLIAEKEYEAYYFGWVMGAVDWLGLSNADRTLITDIVTEDLSNFACIVDRSHQGMLNALMLMRLMMQKDFYTHSALMINGSQMLNPDLRGYLGVSLGGIYGTTYMSASTDVRRGVINVGGTPFSLLLPRSVDFQNGYSAIKLNYPTPADRIFVFNIFQLLFDRIEPAGWLHHLAADTNKTILGQYALGDSHVTWLGHHNLGRSLNCYMYASQVKASNMQLYGFNVISGRNLTHDGEHLILGWDYGAPEEPPKNVPAPSQYDTHGLPWRTFNCQKQADVFFRTGVRYNPCDGPCYAKRPSEEEEEEEEEEE